MPKKGAAFTWLEKNAPLDVRLNLGSMIGGMLTGIEIKAKPKKEPRPKAKAHRR